MSAPKINKQCPPREPTAVNSAQSFFDNLNQDYLSIHRREGELYWLTHTGQSDDHAALAAASLERKLFTGDASRLAQCKHHLATLGAAASASSDDALVNGLKGWVRVFESNATGSPHAEALLKELSELNADLYARRQSYELKHIDDSGARVSASPAALRTNLATNHDEDARKSSHEALHGLERWVLESGFLDIVSKRNALARELGFDDFFEYRLHARSGITSKQLFAVFDQFEKMTRESHRESQRRLVQQHGAHALLPHNLMYRLRGEMTGGDDQYFPFAKALERWSESFRRMGVSYRGARMEIDMLDRPGKFPTGFCVVLVPSYVDDASGWMPADIRFTSTARPAQPGAGVKGLKVLFHEAGHAAHLANVARNSPCFAQEFAPTTPAFLETQAKFFDALPADPCWLKRYATDRDGNSMPDSMIRERLEAHQMSLAHMERRDLIPTYLEAALYRMSDEERTPDRVIAAACAITNDILGVADHTDHVLAMPHLVFHDIAVYYHGYLLAKMAAAQMRAYLTRRLGYIVDNPAVGALLTEHCWKAGNSITLDDALVSLTGEPLSAGYLAEECNRAPADAWRIAGQAMREFDLRSQAPSAEDLDARIFVVHGEQCVATNAVSAQSMFDDFEAWIGRQLRD
ncbi:M3 family metallopeptidase [Paraburkholderia megapolitana]|uniref:Oligoendopeptidase F n=1 Tax=Paraburkholderia megapolitana TaxID=420953 RepID=A0A1I3KWW2_9BURK|nr:M3 family metallopeptidase [Paraburkholderia megapolitana]QDQ80482.1 peptidase M3 [Paraburkholderia megapolitana]SFI76926.1 Oligoendopeptidase F [Paraburkholderia megapolitana]